MRGAISRTSTVSEKEIEEQVELQELLESCDSVEDVRCGGRRVFFFLFLSLLLLRVVDNDDEVISSDRLIRNNLRILILICRFVFFV